MARGKHGEAAAIRRAHEAVESQIETYKRHVKRLTEENRELKEKLRSEQTGRRQDVRALKAQLNEGLTPELVALRRKLDQQSERAAAATQQLGELKKSWLKVAERFQALLVSHFAVSRPDAAIALSMFSAGTTLPDPVPGTSDQEMARMRKRLGGQDGVDRVLMADRRAGRYYRNDEALIDAVSRIAGRRESA